MCNLSLLPTSRCHLAQCLLSLVSIATTGFVEVYSLSNATVIFVSCDSV